MSSDDGQGATWGQLVSEVAWTLGKVATFIAP